MYVYCILIDDVVAHMDVGTGKAMYQPQWRAKIGRHGTLYDEIRDAWATARPVSTEKLITCATMTQAMIELARLQIDPDPTAHHNKLLKYVDADGHVDLRLFGKRPQGENYLASHALYKQAASGVYLAGEETLSTPQPDEP